MLEFDQFLVNVVRGETKKLGVSETTLIKYKEAHRVIHDALLDGSSSGYDIFLSGTKARLADDVLRPYLSPNASVCRWLSS